MIDSHHPRAESLQIRDKIVHGVSLGITSLHGLVAQGRGEAFDYLIGEKTQSFAQESLRAASALLLLAEYPVLSVNGNTAALCAAEYGKLGKVLDCPIEINLFHRTLAREKAIQTYLLEQGANNIVGVGDDASEVITGIASPRKFVSHYGIKKADVIFVPLEDGDRAQALINQNKKVITIDLNPLSRTAQQATITIVDNIVRALPLLISITEQLQRSQKSELQKIIDEYDNKKILSIALKQMKEQI